MLLAAINEAKITPLIAGLLFIAVGCLGIFGYAWAQRHWPRLTRWRFFFWTCPLSRSSSVIGGLLAVLLGAYLLDSAYLHWVDESCWPYTLGAGVIATVVAAINDIRRHCRDCG